MAPKYGFVAVLVAVGFLIRFYQIGALNLWCDEDITALAVKGTLQNGFPQLPSGVIYFRSLLTTYLSSLSVAIFGFSEMALRLPGLLFGLCTIVIIYLLGKRLFSEQVGLLAAFILTFSAWDVEFARHARMYSALSFFFTISLYAIYRGVVQGEKRWLGVSVVLSVLTLLAHILGVVLALVYLGLALHFRRQKGRAWQLAGISGLVLASGAALFALIEFGFSNPDQRMILAYVQKFQVLYNYFRPESTHGLRLQHAIAGLVVMLSFGAAQILRKRILRAAHWAWGVPAAMLLFLAMGQVLAALLFWGLVVLNIQGNGRQALGKAMRLSAAVLLLMTVIRAGLVLEQVFAQATAPAALTEQAWQAAKLLAGFPKLYILGFFSAFPLMTIFALAALAILYQKSSRERDSLCFRFVFVAFVLPLLANGVILNEFIEYRINFYLNPLFVLLFAFALFELGNKLIDRLPAEAGFSKNRYFRCVAPVVLVLLLCEQLRPDAISQTVLRSYGDPIVQATAPGSHLRVMPDHVSSAEYVKIHRAPGDVLIVNDWLAQSIYSRQVDFWLRTKAFQHQAFIAPNSGKAFDIYTGTEMLTSLDALREVIEQSRDGNVWLILSLPFLQNNLHISDDVLSYLQQNEQHVVFHGQDNVSRVFRFSGPGPANVP